MTRARRYGFALSFLALAFVFFGGASQADASTGLRIQPVKISVEMKPGETTGGTIVLTNISATPVSVSSSVNDFVPQAGQDSIQFVPRAPGVTSVEDWIRVEATSTVFAPGETREIPYTITAPMNAEPGGHFGVVFFKAVEADNQATLKIGTQVGMLVLVSIPGNHLQKGKIVDFTAPKFVQTGPVNFEMHFENTGTVHFEPKGKIEISNMFGQVVATIPVEGEIVLPTSIKRISIMWNTAGVLLGRYTARATITDGEGDQLTSGSVSLWAFPVWYMVAFIVVLVVVFLLFRFLRRRVRITLVK